MIKLLKTEIDGQKKQKFKKQKFVWWNKFDFLITL